MAEVIKMPLMSDTMEEGVVAEWHVKVGDNVSAGDLLAEIETDKATIEFESFWDGTMLHIGVEAGATVPVGAILAVIGEAGEDYKEALEAAKAEQPAVVAEQAQKSQPEQDSVTQSSETLPPPESAPEKIAETSPSEEPQSSTQGNGRAKASPLAKKMATEKGIDLKTVNGTGDEGRIIKRDIEAFEKSGGAPGTVTPFAPASGEEKYTDVRVSQMKKTIAKRLIESKFSAPHFYLTMEVNMDQAVLARKSMNEVSPVKISFNDLIIKATAVAIRQHPDINVSWMGDHFRKYEHIHVGVAVAIEEGLIVPVIKFADSRTLSQISAKSRELATKARDKKLQPEEFTGNTFTISNLGMFDIDEFTAIINPPEACILAVGRIKETPVVSDGDVVISNIMKMTLSCDHRAVDGATGARFLQTVKSLLEDPVRILI